jgi:hypothetical protein
MPDGQSFNRQTDRFGKRGGLRAIDEWKDYGKFFASETRDKVRVSF